MFKITMGIAAATMLLCGCTNRVNSQCPDLHRIEDLKSLASLSVDPGDKRIAVYDCMEEHAGRLAAGTATNAEVATATVAHCGDYSGIADDEDLRKDARQKAYADALDIVVTDRALHCPEPRTRVPDQAMSGFRKLQ